MRMLPISEEMLEPIFPASIRATIVEQNSKTRLSLAITPTYIFGMNGLSMLFADCKTITAPIKTEIMLTIGIEPLISLSESHQNCFQKIFHFSGLRNTRIIKL